MIFFSCIALECVSMNNQECQIRPQVVNINSNNPFFYPYSIEVNNCSGSCNNINDPCNFFKIKTPEKLCVTYRTPCRASGHVTCPCYLYSTAPHGGH